MTGIPLSGAPVLDLYLADWQLARAVDELPDGYTRDREGVELFTQRLLATTVRVHVIEPLEDPDEA